MAARDEYGRTPLILAAEYNKNPEVIQVLLKAGADIRARGDPEAIEALLKAGANALKIVAPPRTQNITSIESLTINYSTRYIA